MARQINIRIQKVTFKTIKIKQLITTVIPIIIRTLGMSKKIHSRYIQEF